MRTHHFGRSIVLAVAIVCATSASADAQEGGC